MAGGEDLRRYAWIELNAETWAQIDHYKGKADRRMPWVKFYVSRLDDSTLAGLPLVARYIADRLLLLAARTQNRIPAASAALARNLDIPPESTRRALHLLENVGYIRTIIPTADELRMASNGQMNLHDASGKLATTASVEGEGEEEPPHPHEEKVGTRANTASGNPRSRGDNPRALARAAEVEQAAAAKSPAAVVARLRRSIVETDFGRIPVDELELVLRDRLAGDVDLEAHVGELVELAARRGRPAAPEPEL